MKHFASLYKSLDATNSTNKKIEILHQYFEHVTDNDKLWTIALFSSKRPRRTVQTSYLRQWASELSNIPQWLFEESYHIVGDLAETIALLIPSGDHAQDDDLTTWISKIMSWKDLEIDDKKSEVLNAWKALSTDEIFVFNKIITGGFRIGVSKKTVIKALSKLTGQDENQIAHRLSGNWLPTTTTFDELINQHNVLLDASKPYPFCLAHPLEDKLFKIPIDDFQIEYKWDGIRGQLIYRRGEIFLWSRGEDLVTEKFPEISSLKDTLENDVVLDGEILAYKDGRPLSFGQLQLRLGRKSVTKKLLEEVPVIFMVYDIMELDGADIRDYPLSHRSQLLQKVLSKHDEIMHLKLSQKIEVQTWDDARALRTNARALNSEGLMVKHKEKPYVTGRKKDVWWKWKVEPLTIDGVLLYAQQGHGRRSNLFTDFTFAVWDGDNLVPFTKAYSGLTDAEFLEITRWVRKNTKEKFGPVRSVAPYYVFELAFEGIQASTRHKSGVALRFPRILRWRKDKQVQQANTLDDLKALLTLYG